ncbi:hypothetical protein [Staphylospora marina]|uniref:hypothetical protein n=1 Tax=Staphylospora marina TaxID=2490858 RepID=UPI000F5C2236|nr:hypothetical protein [Staphylospora marina]
MKDVVSGLLDIITPLAIIGILVSAIGMYLSTEEHNRERFKKSLISISIVTIIAFMAQGIIKWLEVKF